MRAPDTEHKGASLFLSSSPELEKLALLVERDSYDIINEINDFCYYHVLLVRDE